MGEMNAQDPQEEAASPSGGWDRRNEANHSPVSEYQPRIRRYADHLGQAQGRGNQGPKDIGPIASPGGDQGRFLESKTIQGSTYHD